ncbi:hypothetical protein V5G24_17505 [Xanthobacter sp. VTT E-85241]|uniref:hypothetical protein n=1 Tax=Roseixanthobacter finlandensis TaxID=3119922 RepID=UPI0037294899
MAIATGDGYVFKGGGTKRGSFVFAEHPGSADFRAFVADHPTLLHPCEDIHALIARAA